jgi:large subunit ribosomal protein L17
MRHLMDRKIRKQSVARSLVRSIILHKKARTTVARAKKIRPVIERLITAGLKLDAANPTPTMRLLCSRLSSWDLADKLVKDICTLVKDRPGGYTRIVKLGMLRKGDAAKEAIISIVE